MLQSKEKYHVYITHNTYRGMLLEAGRHPGNESFIQMPGLRIGNNFYFNMVADSGIKAKYSPTMVEKDHHYSDHLATRISEYQDFTKGEMTLAQFHRHLGSYDNFSPGDFPANISLARQYGGAISGLMLIDPEFRLRCWYIDENGNETEADIEINDKAVRDAMPPIDVKRLKETVERNEVAYREVRRVKNRPSTKSRTKESILSKVSNVLKGCSEEGRFMEKREPKVFESVSEIINGEPVKAGTTGNAVVDSTVGQSTFEDAFIDFDKMQEALRPYTVFIPEEYRIQRHEGELKGYYHSETKTYNIVPENLSSVRTDVQSLGLATRKENEERRISDTSGLPGLSLVWNDDHAEISISDNTGAEINIDFYSTQQDIFSRNQGIVEKDRMTVKQAIIAGTGSGGFKVGLELVRAGIGSLIVADNDIFAYHNVCRHECGIHDVGRYKVDCFIERAADINPNCKVYVFRDLIQHVDPAELEKAIWKDSIVLCCADNRHCAYVCNELVADKYKIPMIAAGCGPRASTGEVFYYKPDSGMPCYTCAYGDDKGVDYTDHAVRRRFYATEAELEKLHFQPGMYLDIQLTALFEAKLAIDLLMENEEGYEPKLLPYINQCTVLLNFPVDPEINPYMYLFGKEGERKPITWKTGPAKKNESCSYCGSEGSALAIK